MRIFAFLLTLYASSLYAAEKEYLPEWSDPDVQQCANEFAQYLSSSADFTVEEVLKERSRLFMHPKRRNEDTREMHKATPKVALDMFSNSFLMNYKMQHRTLREGFSWTLNDAVIQVGDVCTFGPYLGISWKEIANIK